MRPALSSAASASHICGGQPTTSAVEFHGIRQSTIQHITTVILATHTSPMAVVPTAIGQ